MLSVIVGAVWNWLLGQLRLGDLALENLALRQQLAVLTRGGRAPRLSSVDRGFWVLLSAHWSRWREVLMVVRPATVVRWHRAGFRCWWRWKSSRAAGRPAKDKALRQLIRQLATQNLGWGAPRIHGELLKLGFKVAQSTVARYMPARRSPPDDGARQRWRTFLSNHLAQAAAIDFFVIPTATFRLMFGFVVLGHDRRRLLHVGVTEHPTGEWTKRQLLAAFPYDEAPRFLHRDRDSIYDGGFRAALKRLNIEDVPSAPRSPWQNPYCERVIGSIRRELFDHVIVLGEAHARWLLKSYQRYYNESRTHLSLAKDAPEARSVQGLERGPRVVGVPVLGGLHHRYERRAA